MTFTIDRFAHSDNEIFFLSLAAAVAASLPLPILCVARVFSALNSRGILPCECETSNICLLTRILL